LLATVFRSSVMVVTIVHVFVFAAVLSGRVVCVSVERIVVVLLFDILIASLE